MNNLTRKVSPECLLHAAPPGQSPACKNPRPLSPGQQISPIAEPVGC